MFQGKSDKEFFNASIVESTVTNSALTSKCDSFLADDSMILGQACKLETTYTEDSES